MKKIITLLMFLILTLSVAAIEPDFILTDDKGTIESQGFFVSSTSADVDKAKRGELISARYEIVWTKDSTESAFQIYYSSQDRTKSQFLKNVYYRKPVAKGTKKYLTVNNIDTGRLEDDWCNVGILMGGKHFVCHDTNGCGTLSSNSKWDLDTNHRGEIEAFGNSFKLICEGFDDQCIANAGKDVSGETYCSAGDVVKDIFTGGTIAFTGECSERISVVENCGTNKCENGVCVKRETEEKLDDGEKCIGLGDSYCKSGNCIVTTCESTKRDDGLSCIENNDCSSNICDENICVKEQIPDETELDDVEGATCDSPIFCDTGSVMIPCEDGVYGQESACPQVSTDTQVNEQKEEEKDFDIKEWINTYQWWLIGGIIVVVIIAGMMMYNKRGGF